MVQSIGVAVSHSSHADLSAFEPVTPSPDLGARSRPWRDGGAATLKTLGIIALALLLPGLLIFPMRGILPGTLEAPNASPIFLLTLLLSQVVMATGAIFLAWRSSAGLRTHLALDKPLQGWRAYVIAIVATWGTVMVINLIRQHVFGHDIYADLRMMAQLFQNPMWPLSVAVLALGAPIAEELLFRGYLMGAFRSTQAQLVVGAVVSTAIWAALHSYTVGGMILVAVLGLMFGAMRIMSGSLRVPLAAHMFNNAVACIVLQLGFIPLG